MPGCQGIGLQGKQDVQPDSVMDAGSPMDASPKMLGKVTSHEAAPTPGVFCALNPFMAHWRAGTGSAWFQWGCALPWHIFPAMGSLSPWQLSHRDCGSGHGEQPELGEWVKAEEDLFQKKDRVPEKKNVSCTGGAEWSWVLLLLQL